MHLAYAVRKRSGLLQVAVYRLLEDGKDYTKMLELDLTHGIAPTYEVDNVPEDLPLDEEDTDTNLSESN